MEIVYCKSVVNVHSRSATPFNVVAVGYLDGITIYFGSHRKREVNIMYEKETGVCCCYEQRFPAEYTVEDCVKALEQILYDSIQKSGHSLHEVRAEYIRFYREHLPKNFVPLWKTNFLIGL